MVRERLRRDGAAVTRAAPDDCRGERRDAERRTNCASETSALRVPLDECHIRFSLSEPSLGLTLSNRDTKSRHDETDRIRACFAAGLGSQLSSAGGSPAVWRTSNRLLSRVGLP